jgi:single-strand DNA-binding protein
MIKLQVIGNLGKDCILNQVGGKNVMNFSVAHTERYKDSQGAQKERVTWVECAYWSDRTGIAPYLKKGTQVYVEGAPELRFYQKNDGTQGASLSLRVQNVQLLGGKPEGQQSESGNGNVYASRPQSAPQQTNYGNSAPAESEPLDDLPF